MVNNQKGFTNIILVVVIVILVGVGGYFVVKKTGLIAQQTSTPTPTQTTKSPTPRPKNETVNWKTYRNEKYRFEVKYPKEWVVGSCDFSDIVDVIYFNFDSQFCNQTRVDIPASIVIRFYNKDDYGSVLNDYRNPWIKYIEQDFVVSGIPAKKFTDSDYGFQFIVFQYQDYTFDIREDTKGPQFFDQFISTFKFTK